MARLLLPARLFLLAETMMLADTACKSLVFCFFDGRTIAGRLLLSSRLRLQAFIIFLLAPTSNRPLHVFASRHYVSGSLIFLYAAASYFWRVCYFWST